MVFAHIQFRWWLQPESNRWHTDFQSVALPTELQSHKVAVQTGIEPAISCVTGRHVNRYTTGPFGCGGRIWTSDLRVMSPTSYQLLHPAIFKWRRKRDSNPRGFYTLSVFKTDPFSQTWVFLQPYSIVVVDPVGLEPTTDRLWAGSSNQLSYGSDHGSGGGTWTLDLTGMNRTL